MHLLTRKEFKQILAKINSGGKRNVGSKYSDLASPKAIGTEFISHAL